MALAPYAWDLIVVRHNPLSAFARTPAVQDSIITSYRDHCQHLSRGGSVHTLMAELMGRQVGRVPGGAEGSLSG